FWRSGPALRSYVIESLSGLSPNDQPQGDFQQLLLCCLVFFILVYYYNFGWKDYGVASLTTILDMVKVMSFAVQEGKMAVHCHAGLGRTGVLLACYLVFTTRMNADQAILFVRSKRPNSIQTRGQTGTVVLVHFRVQRKARYMIKYYRWHY
uniref:Tyrosine specific protein phosphatases domain-containing protein n=1 Tax=Nothobranchius furzeri TaxID=105023 RepID=A0A8C6M4D2_NOTFU